MRVLLAAILLCLATPAWAALTVYGRAGGWDEFRGTGADGRQTCGIGSTNPTDGRAFSLRFALGDSNITFIADKPGWHIPSGTHIAVVMQVGLERPWTEQAMGDGERVQWTMDRAVVPGFDAQFRAAQSMTVTFPAGSERPWVISLNGSTAASNAMGRCVTAMEQAAPPQAAPPPQGPTQPFGASDAGSGSAAAPDEAAPIQAAPIDAAPLQAAPTQAAPTQAAPTQPFTGSADGATSTAPAQQGAPTQPQR